jgi:hypothetical protein
MAAASISISSIPEYPCSRKDQRASANDL